MINKVITKKVAKEVTKMLDENEIIADLRKQLHNEIIENARLSKMIKEQNRTIAELTEENIKLKGDMK